MGKLNALVSHDPTGEEERDYEAEEDASGEDHMAFLIVNILAEVLGKDKP